MSTINSYQVKQAVPSPKRVIWTLEAAKSLPPPVKAKPPVPQAPVNPTYGEGTTLSFKGRSIRALPVDGVPWFALPELAEALELTFEEADKLVHSPDFPAFARLLTPESPEPDPEVLTPPEDVTIVSPIGVWWLTELTDPWKHQGLASWAKREAKALCPAPTTGDPAMFLTLTANGELPPSPTKYSGRRSEWLDLRWSDAGILAPRWSPSEARRYW